MSAPWFARFDSFLRVKALHSRQPPELFSSAFVSPAGSLPSSNAARTEARASNTPPSSSRSGRAGQAGAAWKERRSSGRWTSCSRSSTPTSWPCTTCSKTEQMWFSSSSCESQEELKLCVRLNGWQNHWWCPCGDLWALDCLLNLCLLKSSCQDSVCQSVRHGQ